MRPAEIHSHKTWDFVHRLLRYSFPKILFREEREFARGLRKPVEETVPFVSIKSLLQSITIVMSLKQLSDSDI